MGIPFEAWRSLPGVRDDPKRVALHPDAPTRPTRFQGGAKGSWRINLQGWHPATLNKLMRSVRSRIRCKKADREAMYVAGCRVPFATGPRRVHLAITLGPGQRAADPDAYWKSLLDALVACKLLIDDNRQNVVLDPVEFVRGKEPETTIELFDI